MIIWVEQGIPQPGRSPLRQESKGGAYTQGGVIYKPLHREAECTKQRCKYMNMEKVRDGLWSWLFTAVDDFKHEVDVLGSIRLGVLESITDGLPSTFAELFLFCILLSTFCFPPNFIDLYNCFSLY